MSKETHVRIAGVCNCEVFEHCDKCDPEYFKNRTEPKTFREASRTVVGLTSDDILTLKLLKDSLQPNPHRSGEEDKYLETLNRILKQVG